MLEINLLIKQQIISNEILVKKKKKYERMVNLNYEHKVEEKFYKMRESRK